MAEKPRRQRRPVPEIQIYRPPKARPQKEQEKKKYAQVVEFVDDTINSPEIVKATPRIVENNGVDREPKCRNKGKNGAGKKNVPKVPPVVVLDVENEDGVSVPEEGTEILTIDLRDRIIGSAEDVSRVAEIIKGKADCFLITLEGSGVPTFTELLKLMGPYFSCTLQEGWAETRRKVIKTQIRAEHLKQVVRFLHRGEIKLTPSNVSSLFVVAEYLQIECLMEACRRFVRTRMGSMFDKAIALGVKHIGMASVAEEAIDYVSDNLSEAAEKLVHVSHDIIMNIICRDELKVRSEDEVGDFVLKWLEQGQDREKIKLMIENVRLPHLSEHCFNRLCEALKDSEELPLLESVRANKFAELPEDQLARRLHYDRHIHSVWVESKDRVVPKYFHDDPKLGYRIECLRSRDEKVLSTQLIQSFPEFRAHRKSFQFVTIMNSLLMITHSKLFDFILIYQQQPNGRWVQRVKYRRQEPVPEFAASVFGTELHLCIFNGFNQPLKTLLFHPLSFRDAEDVNYEAPLKLFLSPPRMIFREDFVIYMMESSIEIFDRATTEHQTIKIQPKTRTLTKATKIKFTDILFYEDKLYAYEEPPLGLYDDDFQVLNDRLYVICLKEKKIEATIDVVFPSFKRRESLVLDGKNFHSSRMSIVGSRLVLHKYFSSHDSTMLVEFDPEKNTFNKVAEIRNSDNKTYYKKLVSLLPVHLYKCEHETLLQKYCRSVKDPAQAAELNKLLFYL